jgi:hypothetical protein
MPIDKILSLDQLLDSLGFDMWKTIATTFVLPFINFFGIILCSLSAWIFFQKKFKDSVFYYYRLLCLVYVIHLIHSIPRCILFSPRYFPSMNMYIVSMFLFVYGPISGLLFHFEETLQMAILITRMKIFNPFVREHFTAKPRIISLALFLTCLLIDAPFAPLAVQIESLSTYYYNDPTNGSKQIATFYVLKSSNFSTTLIGRILLAFIGPFLNVLLSVVFGVILNIVSVCLYRSYLKEKREKDEAYMRVAFNRDQATTSSIVLKAKKFTQKEINETRAEKNMLYMALTLSSWSILASILFIMSFIGLIYFDSFSSNLTFKIINLTIYTLGPTTSIFVFYSFNKMFRDELRQKVFKNLNKDTNLINTTPN